MRSSADHYSADDEGAGRVTLVPHTHWDREWYEPFAVFSEWLVRMTRDHHFVPGVKLRTAPVRSEARFER